MGRRPRPGRAAGDRRGRWPPAPGARPAPLPERAARRRPRPPPVGPRPCASSAAMMPLSTSPVPAVARRASPSVTIRARPSGPATTVVGPFRSTVAPVAAARPRAAARRSGPGGAPARRSYSPSWGVRTVSERPASTAAASAPSAVRASPSTTAGSVDPASTSRTRGLGGRTRAETRADHQRPVARERHLRRLRPIPRRAGGSRPPPWAGRDRRRPRATRGAPCRRRRAGRRRRPGARLRSSPASRR